MREYKKNGIKIKSLATNIWRVLIVAIWFLPMAVFADGTDRFYVDITILENGDISLDDSIKKYTEAMKLVKECDSELKNIEDKVNKIVNENGKLEDFEIS